MNSMKSTYMYGVWENERIRQNLENNLYASFSEQVMQQRVQHGAYEGGLVVRRGVEERERNTTHIQIRVGHRAQTFFETATQHVVHLVRL